MKICRIFISTHRPYFGKKKSLTTNKKYTGWPKLMKNKIQDGFRQLHVCRNEYA